MKFVKYCAIAIATTALVAAPAFAQGDSDSTATTAPASKKAVRAQHRQTEKTIRKALAKTKGLDATNIFVVFKNGAIALNGSVPDASQIQLAQDSAQHAAQGLTVTNHLSVKEPQ